MAKQFEVFLKGSDSVFVGPEDATRIKQALDAGQPATVTVRQLSSTSETTLVLAHVVRIDEHPGKAK